MVDSVTHFNIRHSVFDIAAITVVKVVVLWLLYTFLEDTSMHFIIHSYNAHLRYKKQVLHLSIILLSLVIWIYSIIKGSLILYDYVQNPQFKPMHVTYTAACIITIGTCFIELAFALYSFKAMKRLKELRILQLYNEDGQLVDEQGNIISEKASLKRVIKLAKPVRSY
jgi:hypothetical protein